MTGVTKVKIEESAEELRELLRKQKTALGKERIQSFIVFTENSSGKDNKRFGDGLGKRKRNSTKVAKDLYRVWNHHSSIKKEGITTTTNHKHGSNRATFKRTG